MNYIKEMIYKLKFKIKEKIKNYLISLKESIKLKIKGFLIRNKKRLIIGTSYIVIILALFIWNNPFFITDLFNNKFSLSNIEIEEINTNQGEKIALNTNPTSWIWPTSTNYVITSNYTSYHTALDIIPQDGNFNAYATYPGEVVTNSYKGDNGKYIVIKQDDGKYTMYAHLSSAYAPTGSRVNQGDVIGIIGATGNATGAHLHFSIWYGYPHSSTPLNPWTMY